MAFEVFCIQCQATSRLAEPPAELLVPCPVCGQPIFLESPAPSPASGIEGSNLTSGVSAAAPAVPAAALEPEAQADMSKPLAAAGDTDRSAPDDSELGSDQTDMLSEVASIFEPNEAEPTLFVPARSSAEWHFEPNDEADSSSMDSPAQPARVEPSAPTAMSEEHGEDAGKHLVAATEPPTEPLLMPAADPAVEPEPLGFPVPGTLEGRSAVTPPALNPTGLPAPRGTDPTAKLPMRMGVLATVYVCGMILGFLLGWWCYGRRAASSAGPTGLELIRDYGMRQADTKWVSPETAVPPGQRKRLGETIYLGHLAVTALGVERRPVSLVRSDPLTKTQERIESEDKCLVLHVLLRNTSLDVEFSPLDEMFLRPHDPKQWPTYSFIQCEDGSQIPMYSLAEYSEYSIEGQPFRVLKPGQESDAIIAACVGSPALVKGRMLWRLQLRAGGPRNQSYSTVVGFEFTPEQIRG